MIYCTKRGDTSAAFTIQLLTVQMYDHVYYNPRLHGLIFVQEQSTTFWFVCESPMKRRKQISCDSIFHCIRLDSLLQLFKANWVASLAQCRRRTWARCQMMPPPACRYNLDYIDLRIYWVLYTYICMHTCAVCPRIGQPLTWYRNENHWIASALNLSCN